MIDVVPWPVFWQAIAQTAVGILIFAVVILSVAAFVKWMISRY